MMMHTPFALRHVITFRVRGHQRGLLVLTHGALLVCHLLTTPLLRRHHYVCLTWMTLTEHLPLLFLAQIFHVGRSTLFINSL